MKELKINVPEGYEIDTENSTFECIKFKPIAKVWSDIERIRGKYITDSSDIEDVECKRFEEDKNVFISEKYAKSALAMAQISQLLPYYGGFFTDEEWKDPKVKKYCIIRTRDDIDYVENTFTYRFIAFRTSEYRKKFMLCPENVQLVKEYLML